MPPRKTTRTTTRQTAVSQVPLDAILIECVTPELDGGRYPVKRVAGDTVFVGADVIKDGHDVLAARLLWRAPDEAAWQQAPLRYHFDTDRWYGQFRVDRVGTWKFTVEAWTDVFRTWRDGLRKKADAAQEVGVELLEGAQMVRAAVRRVKDATARAELLQTAKLLEDAEGEHGTQAQRVQRALDPALLALMDTWLPPRDLTRYRRELEVRVDPERARFGAWYELFPRSQNPEGRHGTFADVTRRLPRLAEIGYDVLYLPPVHPIGRTFRKGKNNTLTPAPDDVGSPWAIGNELGGHEAIEPALGTVDDFVAMVQRANELGIEIALDYALQCSPDHPWVKEHPDWFHVRPDGTIQYAENPPKKYQDIYPINFWCEDRQSLWDACRDVLLLWIDRGVRIFRVDNPHTKPLAFWEWVIAEVHREHPDVVFFAEAFTRPKRMKALAKLGFSMSYTYFTWKNTAWELRDYVEELTQTPMAEYYRGNFFANTPDILNEYLVHGGRPAFRIRLLLASTLLPSYGLYSGYELYENVPVRPGSEEYLDSEKYQIKPRDWEAPGNLNPEIARLNRIRREEPALRRYANLTFHASDNPAVLCYRKAGTEVPAQWIGGHRVTIPAEVRPAGASETGLPRSADLFMIVNLDPHHVQEATVEVPVRDLGIGDDESYDVVDLLTGVRYTWRGSRNYVRLDPREQVGHLLRIERTAGA